jgi:hypothetical protein
MIPVWCYTIAIYHWPIKNSQNMQCFGSNHIAPCCMHIEDLYSGLLNLNGHSLHEPFFTQVSDGEISRDTEGSPVPYLSR